MPVKRLIQGHPLEGSPAGTRPTTSPRSQGSSGTPHLKGFHANAHGHHRFDRPGRAGLPIGEWFAGHVEKHGHFDLQVADLAKVDLPLLSDPHHPRLRQYVHQHTWDWSALVEAADAFVFVTPEYNYGYPATIKNAIDHLSQEWAYAPVGFVSYGGVAAGTRAVQQLKQVVTTLRMVPVLESVNLPFHTSLIADGVFGPTPVIDAAADAMLGELARVEEALRPLRAAARPSKD